VSKRPKQKTKTKTKQNRRDRFENPDMNNRFSNIESIATCKHHMQEMMGYHCEKGKGKLKSSYFVIKFGCQDFDQSISML